MAIKRGFIVGEDFLRIPEQPIKIRDRSNVSSLSLRKPEMLPPDEMSEAIRQIVSSNFGARHDELIHECSRRFGFSATSSQLRDVLSNQIDKMIALGELEENDGLLTKVVAKKD